MFNIKIKHNIFVNCYFEYFKIFNFFYFTLLNNALIILLWQVVIFKSYIKEGINVFIKENEIFYLNFYTFC